MPGNLFFALIAAAAVTSGAAFAQSYPSRPIHLIVPFAPGGGADIAARVISEPLAKRLGQPIVVENRPGGGATLGADLVAKSIPDGYTLLYGTPGPQITNPYLMKKLPYDPAKDFAPISRLVVIPSVLVVNAGLAAKSVTELIALAKSQPRKLNFASAGIGATSHLAGELFKVMAGIDIVHVPYKGTGAALQDLLAGNVQMAIDSIPVYQPYIKSGVLRVLAVSTLQRSPVLPGVPAIAETLPGFDAAPMNYLAARAGTPRAVIERINREVNAVLTMPEVHERLTGLGIIPQGSTPESLDAEIMRESAKWKKVIESSGAKAE
ncbi:MAG: tripartite tricarboxylate transporter substrate binding protein [Betaproteobacteria bacterium]|nr:tripartite tricarboxylate transporter substrate binding protein [Betaproteobacteria bacterium]